MSQTLIPGGNAALNSNNIVILVAPRCGNRFGIAARVTPLAT